MLFHPEDALEFVGGAESDQLCLAVQYCHDDESTLFASS